MVTTTNMAGALDLIAILIATLRLNMVYFRAPELPQAQPPCRPRATTCAAAGRGTGAPQEPSELPELLEAQGLQGSPAPVAAAQQPDTRKTV